MDFRKKYVKVRIIQINEIINNVQFKLELNLKRARACYLGHHTKIIHYSCKTLAMRLPKCFLVKTTKFFSN